MAAEPESQSQKESPQDPPRPLGEHFEELRWRLIVSIAAVLVASTACWIRFDLVNALVLRPLRLVGARLISKFGAEEFISAPHSPTVVMLPTLRPTEGFVYAVKLGLVVGIILASPVVLYEAWAFIAPGLTRRERRVVRPIFFLGAIFFLLGTMMAYFWVVPAALYYLAWVDWKLGFRSYWRPAEYSSFLVTMLLVFGITFELPLLMSGLGFAGIVQPAKLLRPIRYVIAAAFILGAIFTPPDILSQVMLAITLIGLYILGVGFACIGYRYSERKRSEPENVETSKQGPKPHEKRNGS